MNEKEKKAIERAKFLNNIDTYLEKEMLTNLLNLIEKQEREIEIWKETENDYEHELARKDEKIEKQQKEIEYFKKEKERLGRLYYEANENCIKYEKIVKQQKDKIREILNKYAKTDVENHVEIINFYREIKELLGEKDDTKV